MLSSNPGDFFAEEVFSEEQRQLIIENSRLKQSNEQLTTDFNRLQVQFDELINSCPKIEEINKENSLLKKQVSDLNIQYGEIKRRLEISLQTNDDLSEKMTASQNAIDSSYSQQISKLAEKIKQEKLESQKEIERLNEKNKKYETSISQNERELSLLRNLQSKILSLSKNYFKTEFNNIDALCNYLMKPANNGNILLNNNSVEYSSTSSKEVKQYEEKIEHYKEIANNEKIKRKKIQLAFLQYKKNYELNSLTIDEQKVQIEDLKRKHENIIKQLETSHKQELMNLSTSLTPNIKYKSILTQADLIIETKNPNKEADFSQPEKKKSLENTIIIEQMKIQIENLIEQLKKGEEKQENQREKNKNLQIKITRLEKELKSTQRKYLQSSSSLQQAQQEIESLNEQLKYLPKDEDIISRQEKVESVELSNTRKAVEILQNVTISQKEDIKKLTKERDHILSIVQFQNQTLECFEKVMENMIINHKMNENEDKESDFVKLSSMIQEEQNIEWDYGTLPESIVSIIRRFTENEGFSIESKFHHIFNVLSKWHKNIEISHNNEILELQEKLDESNQKYERYHTTILNSLGEQNHSGNENISVEDIADRIADLSSGNAILQQKINELEAFKADSLIEPSTESVNPVISKLQRTLKDTRSKYNLLRIELKECKAAFIEVQKRSADEIETLREANERTRNELNELQAAHDELHFQNQNLTHELTEARNAQVDGYNQSQEEFESILMQNSSNFDDFQNKTNRDLHEKNVEISKLKRKVEELSKSAAHWEQMAKNIGEEATKLKSRLTKTQNENEQRIIELNKQRESDIKDLEIHYTKVNDTLVAKNSELMEQIRNHKPIHYNPENDLKIQELEAKISQLNFQIQQDASHSQSQIDALERQNKLIQVQNRAKLMAAETNYSMKCDEIRKSFELKKKELFGFIAQQFRAFYDVKTNLNEDTVMIMVKKIKIEITKMKKKEDSIRKIINAREGQSTEDALTEIILAMHPQLVEQTPRKSRQ
ncbi:hypothetical protein TRFO_01347 [Tritrichomonas foetus]|uniref:Uncharacterized protein n=1 Tax=Tritrichomonas foetus TaxID=1144522 RepID=A0A1J4K8J2_9EUKA|nr:hypothetical protein TRFO_01347 [Tritrichomonas foetus]|eukprot:OHT07200.1 hypothetical protein TRFO_01347 [Tritrichomonas foetus]